MGYDVLILMWPIGIGGLLAVGAVLTALAGEGREDAPQMATLLAAHGAQLCGALICAWFIVGDITHTGPITNADGWALVVNDAMESWSVSRRALSYLGWGGGVFSIATLAIILARKPQLQTAVAVVTSLLALPVILVALRVAVPYLTTWPEGDARWHFGYLEEWLDDGGSFEMIEASSACQFIPWIMNPAITDEKSISKIDDNRWNEALTKCQQFCSEQNTETLWNPGVMENHCNFILALETPAAH